MKNTKKAVKKTLLECQADGCPNAFEAVLNENIPSSARSIEPAIEAHRAGWVATGGAILCPDCAAKKLH